MGHFIIWNLESRESHQTGSALHREIRESVHKNALSGKTQGIWKFCQNTGNLFAQVVSSLFRKIQDIVVFPANISRVLFAQEIVSIMVQGNFSGRAGKHREFAN